MKIAYLIAAHADPVQLKRLVVSLDEPYCDFYIHIDKKINISLFKSELHNLDIRFIENRVSTNWGGYSQCEYQKALLKAVLSSGISYDRIFFLSGMDYPLWSNRKILDFLMQNPQREHIMGMNLSDCYEPPKMQTRVRQFHFRDLPIRNQRFRRLLYGGIREFLRVLGVKKKNYIQVGSEKYKIYCGSSWWCLTSDCARYVYDFICHHKEVEKYFRTCLAPDEMLIQTIVFNSKFADFAILYDGGYPGLVGLTPLHYIEYNGEIKTYTEKDFELLMESGKMFVRKLKSGISDGLVDKINKFRNQ